MAKIGKKWKTVAKGGKSGKKLQKFAKRSKKWQKWQKVWSSKILEILFEFTTQD